MLYLLKLHQKYLPGHFVFYTILLIGCTKFLWMDIPIIFFSIPLLMDIYVIPYFFLSLFIAIIAQSVIGLHQVKYWFFSYKKLYCSVKWNTKLQKKRCLFVFLSLIIMFALMQEIHTLEGKITCRRQKSEFVLLISKALVLRIHSRLPCQLVFNLWRITVFSGSFMLF